MNEEFNNTLKQLFNEINLTSILYKYYVTYILTEQDYEYALMHGLDVSKQKDYNGVRLVDLANIENKIELSSDFASHCRRVGDNLLIKDKHKLEMINLFDQTVLVFNSHKSIRKVRLANNIITLLYDDLYVEFYNLTFNQIGKSIKIDYQLKFIFMLGDRVICVCNDDHIRSISIENSADIIAVYKGEKRGLYPYNDKLIIADEKNICLYNNKLEELKVITQMDDVGMNIYEDTLLCFVNDELHLINVITNELITIIKTKNKISYVHVVYNLIVVDTLKDEQNYLELYDFHTYEHKNTIFNDNYLM